MAEVIEFDHTISWNETPFDDETSAAKFTVMKNVSGTSHRGRGRRDVQPGLRAK